MRNCSHSVGRGSPNDESVQQVKSQSGAETRRWLFQQQLLVRFNV
ncbi:hypothetical protein GA0070624_6058 [Micromonospora rhizosphaerae]|uniref:Uncharacterized protein n=1 Tax=Micromonospora rhizosphaerae TaxID=568872 RepID=A0A1C6T8J5_9ACTN|nr:hypothetical protein [Micromonospora rhizosphaerae]SCL37987.1 hypothetical protein GA0070624_6058 [Micromonospora rhizosphaerae]